MAKNYDLTNLEVAGLLGFILVVVIPISALEVQLIFRAFRICGIHEHEVMSKRSVKVPGIISDAIKEV